MVEVLSGRAITLEVELIAFEEIQQPHQVRMQAGLVLRDDRTSLLQETITVERPVAEGGGADRAPAVVDAFSQALRAGVTQNRRPGGGEARGAAIAGCEVRPCPRAPHAATARNGGPG